MRDQAAALGERLAKTLGNGPSRSSLLAQEEALAQAAARLGRRGALFQRETRLAVAASCAVVACVVLAIGIFSSSTEAKRRDRTVVMTPGAVVETEAAGSQTFSLPDGSTVMVDSGSQAELTRAEPGWTEVGLARGRLGLDVRKQNGGHFAVVAGPYRVVVVGTRFQVAFDDERKGLSVNVSEGRVRVFGEGLPRDGREIVAGAHFEHSSGSRSGSDAVEPPSADVSNEPNSAAAATPTSDSGRKQHRLNSANSATPTTWQQLARQGRYTEAHKLAEQHGFETLLRELAAGDLLMLANSARFAGNSKRARQAFLELRARHGGGAASVLASFYLARIAYDSDRDPTAAARWFRVYLREAPSGQLAAGARVDLMNILLELGDHAGARRVAKDYVQNHPNGPHVDVARSLLSRASDEP